MLKRFKISQKVYILGTIQLLLLVAIGSISLYNMNKIGTEIMDIAEEDIPLSRYLTTLAEYQLEQSVLFERALFTLATKKADGPESAVRFKKDVAHIDSLHDSQNTLMNETIAFVDKAIYLVHDDVTKAAFEKVLGELRTIHGHEKTHFKNLKNLLDNADSMTVEELVQAADPLHSSSEEMNKEMIALQNEIIAFVQKAALSAESHEKSAINWMMITFTVAVLIALVLPYAISKSITRPILELAARLDEIASGDGDLTVKLDERARDETGSVSRAFNRFTEVLRKLISETASQANQLDKSSNVTLDAMHQTVEFVKRQRDETERVAVAANEMSATTQAMVSAARDAKGFTSDVRDKVVEGKEDAEETKQIVIRLAEEVTEASTVIESLEQETNNIATVLESIQGIAEQTNLLALNAAIEAARAGESGRGFAVVADEVRTLSQSTQSSTVNIQELLHRLKGEADNAVACMKKGSESAEVCLEKSEKAARTFEDAAAAVAQISDLNMSIATSVEQQSEVAESINVNITNIRDLANETNDKAHQASAANDKIVNSVHDLHENLSVFTV